MKVSFLIDYRGTLTSERFHMAGSVAEFDDATAAELVKRGRAELVEVEQAEAVSESPDLTSMSVSDLRKLAKAANVDGWKSIRRDALIKALE